MFCPPREDGRSVGWENGERVKPNRRLGLVGLFGEDKRFARNRTIQWRHNSLSKTFGINETNTYLPVTQFQVMLLGKHLEVVLNPAGAGPSAHPGGAGE